MSCRVLVCVTVLASQGGASSSSAVDYSWQNSAGGAFHEFSNWSPAVPPGPGGASDTVNFDLGAAASSRYLLPDVSGENNQLIVHNDSVELVIFIDYALLSMGGANPSLIVGAASGDTGDVVFSGASTSVLETQSTRIGNVAGSTGVVTANALQWNGQNLRVGFAGEGTLTIADDASVSSTNASLGHLNGAAGTVSVQDGTWTTSGNLLVGRDGDGLLLVSGNVTSADVSIASEPTGAGTTHVDGTWTIQNTLTIGEAGDANLAISSGSVSSMNAAVGHLPGSDGFVAISDGAWTTTGRLTIGGENIGGTSGGSGLVRISGGDVTVEEIVIRDSGLLEMQGGFLTPASVTLETGAQFDFTAGIFRLNQFNGQLVNEGGSLLPDDQVEAPIINGDYTQQSGRISFSILGAAANNLYNSLEVTGTATLGGDLVLSGATLYEPSSDEVYTLIQAGDIIGSFDNVASGQRLANSVGSFVVYYGSGSPFNADHVILTDFIPDALAGDYNQNGVVDAADYTVWRDALGASVAPGSSADGNSSGTVDAGDYPIWKANFGSASGAGASSRAAVPEPFAIALFAGLLLAGMIGRFRCRTA